jgi:hypothetical protein
MKKLILISALALLFATPSWSQVTDTGAANFLEITPDAHSAAMGGAGAASSYGLFRMFHNPALMGFDRTGGIGYSFTKYGEHNLHTVGASYAIGKSGNIFAGFRSFTYEPYDLINDSGDVTGTFKQADWAGEAGYSMMFGENLSAGVTARYVSSKFAPDVDASAFAFDLGVAYRRGISIGDAAAWTASLAATNFGTKMDGDQLPGKVKLGLGLDMLFAEQHGIEAIVDAGYRMLPSDVASFEAGLGLQYRFRDMVMVRCGYHIGDVEKNGLGNYFTFGAGVKFYHFQLDAAYSLADKTSVIGNVLTLSLGMDFGIFGE